jgi:hypothetical protein
MTNDSSTSADSGSPTGDQFRPPSALQSLSTPPNHGDTLIHPAPAELPRLARQNRKALRAADCPLLDASLAEYRGQVRRGLLGTDDTLAIVTGHQPEFIHPGVWAKHVVACRLAEAVNGRAINLVVDHDESRRPALSIPVQRDGRWHRQPVPTTVAPGAWPFDQLPAPTAEECQQIANAARQHLGPHLAGSMLPIYLEAWSRTGGADAPTGRESADWAAAHLRGREAVEQRLGINIEDIRSRDLDTSGFVVALLQDAQRFATHYNEALAAYRRAQRIRQPLRPMPDLVREGHRCETPFWAYRPRGPRERLLAERRGGILHLSTPEHVVGTLPADRPITHAEAAPLLAALDSWQIRPRALTFTLWARLCLADLFIHGIGGALYDRITDRIISSYFDLTPPAFACVSATLHLGLVDSSRRGVGSQNEVRSSPNGSDEPDRPVGPNGSKGPNAELETVRAHRRALRDLIFNPQRHLAATSGTADLIEARREAARTAANLKRSNIRDRHRRRDIYLKIRRLNAQLLAAAPEAVPRARAALQDAEFRHDQARITRDRTYFFALYPEERLRELLANLPAAADFRV